jgi:hypothetical protein
MNEKKTTEAPEKTPRAPKGAKGTQLAESTCGKPAQSTKAMRVMLTAFTLMFSSDDSAVERASTALRVVGG